MDDKYQKLVETTGTGYLILDMLGNVVDANNEYVRLTGRKNLKEILGKNVTEWTAPYDLKRNADEVKKAIKTGSVKNLEIDYIDKKGTITPIEINAKIIDTENGKRIMSLCRDISVRKEIQKELIQKTTLFEALLNSVIDGVLVVDSKGLKLFQNQRCIELWKIPKEIVDNKDDNQQLEFVKNRTVDPEKFVEKVVYLYSHPTEKSRDEVFFKDGMILDRYSAPVIGNDGTNFGRIWIFRDVTESHTYNESLKRTASILKDKNEELKKINDLMVGRELKMVELKKENEELKKKCK